MTIKKNSKEKEIIYVEAPDGEILEKNENEENIDDDISDDDELNEDDSSLDTEDKIEEDNIVEEELEETDLDIYFKFGTNNHKLEGKHSLKRDTIFNGKISENEQIDEYGQYSEFDLFIDGESPIEKGTIFEDESKNNEELVNRRNLAHDVYTLLNNNTGIDFSANRRKPNKITFNIYYKLLLDKIGRTYTKCEIFVELSYYFTDNIFNMFKLLDKKYAMGILREIRDKGYLMDIFGSPDKKDENDNTSINFM